MSCNANRSSPNVTALSLKSLNAFMGLLYPELRELVHAAQGSLPVSLTGVVVPLEPLLSLAVRDETGSCPNVGRVERYRTWLSTDVPSGSLASVSVPGKRRKPGERAKEERQAEKNKAEWKAAVDNGTASSEQNVKQERKEEQKDKQEEEKEAPDHELTAEEQKEHAMREYAPAGNEHSVDDDALSTACDLNCTLRDYQSQSVRWLLELERAGRTTSDGLWFPLTFEDGIKFFYSPFFQRFRFTPLPDVQGKIHTISYNTRQTWRTRTGTRGASASRGTTYHAASALFEPFL